MSTEREHWKEQLDACRPGHEDWQLPELSELATARATNPVVARIADRSHAWDEVVGSAMRDVPVPTGLESRLLAALQVPAPPAPPVEASDSSVTATPSATTTIAGRPQPVPPVRRTNRRLWLVTAGVCAASLLVGLLVALPRPAPWNSAGDVVVHFQRWLPLVAPEHWRRNQWPTQRLPIPGDPYAWQSLAGTWTSLPADCYDLAPPGPRAFLFVCQVPEPANLPSQLPRTATPSGDGWSLGAWRDTTGNVFVLAVEGSQARYSRFASASSKLAHRQVPPPKKKPLIGTVSART